MKAGFAYKGNDLMVDGLPLAALAEEHGTPLYVYSAAMLRENYRRIVKHFKGIDVHVAYSVKSNSNLSILSLLAKEGSYFDIVSGGELERVRKVGVPAGRVIFAGVGKSAEEMRAALKAGVAEFNLESEMEAERLNALAASMRKTAPVAIRVNPDIDAGTHKYISTGKAENKFGISMDRALALSRRIGRKLANLRLEGLHCHIGSQILDPTVHPRVVEKIADFARLVVRESGARLRTLNLGGGFGIAYRDDQNRLDLTPFATAVKPVLKELGVSLLLEPGRSISGPAGLLLTRVEYIKPGEKKTFVIIDASMTELIRPTLYEAYHEIQPVRKAKGAAKAVDVVGPVCETGDFLAQAREMVVPAQGDLLAIRDAGAYGFVMASHYNTRRNPAEVLVDDGKAHVIRRRETYADLMKGEVLPD